jgi:hypothetical protein
MTAVPYFPNAPMSSVFSTVVFFRNNVCSQWGIAVYAAMSGFMYN